MSNAKLIDRIGHALDRYERGELEASEVERAVDLHFPALERIETRERSEANHLAARLVRADLSDPPALFKAQPLTFEGDEPVSDVVRNFRAFLARLPR